MREIKFRGKRESSGEWYIGDFITDTSEFSRTCDRAYILPYWDTLNSPIRVAKETIGQYTGLLDKNGTEIFEGDIVQVRYEGGGSAISVSAVDFEKGCFVFEETAPWELKSTTILGKVIGHENFDVKIIGNVHDDPELLEVTN